MKDLNFYLSLPYTIMLVREDDATWFARVLELPGCMTEGDSAAEAAEMIQDAMTSWLEVALDDGMTIPEPRPEEDFSGKFVVRVAKSLHRDLVEAADREGVSLNQFINTALARAVGRAERAQPEGGLRPLSDLMARVERLLHKLDNASAPAWAGAGKGESLGRRPGRPAPAMTALNEQSAPYKTSADEEAAAKNE